MGRWSAGHRKTAIFGWLAFVVAAFAIGNAVGMKTDRPERQNVGQARKADHISAMPASSSTSRGSSCSSSRRRMTVDDPAFRAVVPGDRRALDRLPQSQEAPLAARSRRNDGQISPDGHTALIQCSPKGSYDEADDLHRRRSRPHGDAVAEAPTRASTSARPARRRTGKALDEMFKGQLAQAGLVSIPLTLGDPAARVRLARRRGVPLLLALTSVFATMGLRRAAEPDRPDGQSDLRGDPADRARSRRRLLALLHQRERDERRAGRSESGRARGGRSDLGSVRCSSRASR